MIAFSSSTKTIMKTSSRSVRAAFYSPPIDIEFEWLALFLAPLLPVSQSTPSVRSCI